MTGTQDKSCRSRMENRQIEVVISFKAVLKEILEKLLLPPSYVVERYRPDHSPSFIANAEVEDGYGKKEDLRKKRNNKEKSRARGYISSN
ncbi:unnamed protein product [Camellia sinensis]